MRHLRRVLILGLLGSLAALGGAEVASARENRCNKTTELTSLTDASISSSPAYICSVQLFATSANASAVIFDSPSTGDSTHGQSVMIAEPGVATAGESQIHGFGESEGHPTQFGLGGRVKNGRVIVFWGS